MMGVADFALTTMALMASEQCGLIAFLPILTESNKLCYSEKIFNFFFCCCFLFACTSFSFIEAGNPLLLCDEEVGFLCFSFTVSLKAEC